MGREMDVEYPLNATVNDPTLNDGDRLPDDSFVSMRQQRRGVALPDGRELMFVRYRRDGLGYAWSAWQEAEQ